MSVLRRPILRYHGGKWLLAPWIISHFPPLSRYVEPFGGAASVLLRKSRSHSEIYNDLDREVYTLFKVARDDGQRLARAIELTPFSRQEFQEAYKKTRSPIEMCRRTIIRSFMGFGSDGVHSTHRTGFRGISERSGTTPAMDWRNFPDALRVIIERLRGVVIESKPALEVIDQYDNAKTLFYVDPPYVASTRKRVDQARGYRHEMTDEAHLALGERLRAISGMAVVSGYPCAFYDRLYKGWRRVERTGPFSDGARVRTEVLWLSPGIRENQTMLL